MTVIAGIVRGNDTAVKEFERLSGVTCLRSCLSLRSRKIVIKACFLLQSLYQQPDGTVFFSSAQYLYCTQKLCSVMSSFHVQT